AAFYFAAFEYQLYNGKGLDEEMFRRQKLVLTGVQQFFKDIYEVYNYNPSVNPFADPLIGRETNLEASFNAIAAALHKENPKQKESIEALNNKGMQLREIQFLELIKQGLLDGEKLKNREVNLSQISDISREVLNNEDVSVKLLQARWAILLVAALDKDVTFHKGGSWRYFISAWKLITKWDLDFSKINSSDLDEQRKYLKASLETRDFLTSIGVKTETPSLAKMFIQRMRPLNIEKLSESDQQVANDILEYLAKLKK
ncbi:MAG: hypothetical protein KDD45_14060, partial [Bdellovibrionales bacterium]|nr:hypothetical protein [Bdellovibrionales bacterium]